MKARLLQKGDWIAIAAPASPFDRRRFLKNLSLLRKTPFHVRYRRDIFFRKNYLAGDDRRRAQELNHFLTDRKTHALLFARGGFGSGRLLSRLKGPISPKVVIGSSDLTVVLNYLWKRHRLPTFYGPMVTPHLTTRRSVRQLVAILTDPSATKRQRLVAKRILRPGRVDGRLIGGCLSLIVATLGTPWEMETAHSILFLEDAHEEAYAVDRMLTQLEQAGKFRSVRGIVFGTFRQGRDLFPQEVEKVMREKFSKFRGPILWGLRFGHCSDPLFLPFGGMGRIEGKRLIIEKGVF